MGKRQGAAGGTRRTGSAAWNGTRSRASATGRSPRSTAPTCWRSSPRSGTSRRRPPAPCASASGRCWSGPIAMDLRSDNPCDRVLPVLGPQNDIVTHRLALPHREVAAAIETVRASGSTQPAVKLAFEFLVLTAARSAEVRLATWTEINTTDHVWTISAMRMKAKREHRVPLCRRAVEILDEARSLGDAANPLCVPHAEREAGIGVDAAQDAPVPRDRRCGARLPVVVPRLGGRGDGPPARGHRGGAGPRGPEQGRSGVRPF